MGVSGDDMTASLTDSEPSALTNHIERSATMRVKITYFAALLAAGAVAGGIAAAPIAIAAPQSRFDKRKQRHVPKRPVAGLSVMYEPG